MKIVIAGGTGQVGTILQRAFRSKYYQVVVLSRGGTGDGGRPGERTRIVPWDGRTLGLWTKELDGADAIINLAGRSVNCRYNPENRTEILKSRVDSTRIIGTALGQSGRPPKVWLQMGTATIYAHRFDEPNDEFHGIFSGDMEDVPETWKFSSDVAHAWERTLMDAGDFPATRVVLMRSAIVLSKDPGGVFSVLKSLVKRGLGGTVGNGKQMVSWIHETDFVDAVEWLMERPDLSGAINMCAPNPVPNEEFMGQFRKAMGVSFGLPASGPILELGAMLMGTESELVLKSRYVTPKRLLDSGFGFRFPEWPEAVRDLLSEE